MTTPQLDPETLAEVISANRNRLCRLLQCRMDARLRGRVDAEDVLQEAFLEAKKRLWSYVEAESPVFIWLRLVVLQTLVDVHRRHLGSRMRAAYQEVPLKGLPSLSADSAALSEQLAADLTSPSQAAMRAEVAQQLEEGLASMAAIDREVLVLRHFEELDNKEVAQVLGIHSSTASNRYMRALRRLRLILARMDKDLAADSSDDSHAAAC